jgi:uncharacterized membrane protein
MDRSSLILSFAIFTLFISGILFKEQTYFHPLYIIIFNILGLISAIAFFWAYSQRDKKIKWGFKSFKINPNILIAVIVIFFLISFQLVAVAVLVSIAALYLIKYLSTRKLRPFEFYSCVAIIILITSAAAFLSVSGLRGTNWKGIDEVAYNYYAPYLLLHGTNPYTASMMPIIVEHNITPTYYMNGSIETAYDYPALSFLLVLPLGLLALHGFVIFIAIVALITTISVFFIYKKTKYNKIVLIPIAAWLVVTYLFIGTIGQYIAAAVLLLLAYTERKNILLAAVLLGLAASTIQLAWFALPFFFILILREQGTEKFVKSLAISLVVFLAVNSYFIAVSPTYFFKDIFQIFLGNSKLLLAGTNIVQVLVRSYGVVLWYPTVISVVTLLMLIVLFYFYTSTLKPLIAIAPAFIFFLTWRNYLMYNLAFIPLIIVICYIKDKNEVKDLLKEKKWIPIAFGLLILMSLSLAIYAHGLYQKDDTLVINSVVPAIQPNGTGQYNINGITINITNNANYYENVSIFLINRYPARDGIFLPSQIKPIPPHSSIAYQLNYTVHDVAQNTSIYVMPFSRDYITDRQFNINITENKSG